MRKPEENRRDFIPFCGMFWLNLRWLNSRHILLALLENHEDSHRRIANPCLWEPITDHELTTFHRQLFMWRLMQFKRLASPTSSN